MANTRIILLDELRYTAIVKGNMPTPKAKRMIYTELMDWLESQKLKPFQGYRLNDQGKRERINPSEYLYR